MTMTWSIDSLYRVIFGNQKKKIIYAITNTNRSIFTVESSKDCGLLESPGSGTV
jgi:hypothetical protein